MNQRCYKLGASRSVIRELFEFSNQRKREIGEENVYDFSLGNPSIDPNPKVNETIINLIKTTSPSALHGYTSAPGDMNVRKAIADDLNKRFNTHYDASLLYMTCGAAASLTITLNAIVDSKDDEIIAIAPYFPEYEVFVTTSGAKFKIVEADIPDFNINFASLEKVINKNTKAIIINSPNNPVGSVYDKNTLTKLASFLSSKEKEYDHPIYIIADEPYREIVYDGHTAPHIPSIYPDTIICYSYSKSLSLAGERIGYVLVPQSVKDYQDLLLAIAGSGRSLGYVCAPSLFQKILLECASLTSDMAEYEKNRNLLYQGLKKIGYDCVYPSGAFYLFVKSPLENANEFSELAKKYNLVIVPSDTFGVKGYIRLSYCVKEKTISDSLPAFKKLYDSVIK